MALKILLINPNRIKNPPVIPIGLEFLASALEKHGHDVNILDLCFTSSPVKELDNFLEKELYDIIGFSIRNIDSCIYFNNDFFVPEFKILIDCIKKHNIPVILGGAGFSAMAHEIMDYLQVDYGIIGPGEIALPQFLKLWKANQLTTKILNGWDLGLDDNLIYSRGKRLDYQKYLSNEGIVGFSTHTGCQNQCPYCIEANTKISFKKIPYIIEELEYLVSQGYNHLHLCDSEFNCDLNYSTRFCEALVKKSLPLKWTLYMKPNPYNERLFQLLNDSNAYLITLSVDSDKRTQTLNNYSYDDLTNIIDYCNKYEIELAIDLLTGYPHESLESTKEMIEFFKVKRPKTVGISFYYRVFKDTALEKLIRKEPGLQKYLTITYLPNENFLKPIFFSQYNQKDIEKLIADDALFRIAGIEPGVNYQL